MKGSTSPRLLLRLDYPKNNANKKQVEFNMSTQLNIVYHFYLQILIYVFQKLYIHKSEQKFLSSEKAIIYSSTF